MPLPGITNTARAPWDADQVLQSSSYTAATAPGGVTATLATYTGSKKCYLDKVSFSVLYTTSAPVLHLGIQRSATLYLLQGYNVPVSAVRELSNMGIWLQTNDLVIAYMYNHAVGDKIFSTVFWEESKY